MQGLAVVGVMAILAVASGCGNASEGPATAAPPGNLVSSSEVDAMPAGGVKQAFLEYWSALQFQAWAEATSFYSEAFRDSIGVAAIIGAKKLNAPSYPQLKPALESVADRGGLTTIKYSLRLVDGTRELSSVAWRKEEGNWQIVYDSRLDAELSQLAQNKVELARAGVLPTDISQVSPAARRAGEKAAQAQARFVERELSLTSP
jgi:hypothetical protein